MQILCCWSTLTISIHTNNNIKYLPIFANLPLFFQAFSVIIKKIKNYVTFCLNPLPLPPYDGILTVCASTLSPLKRHMIFERPN